MLMMRSDIRFLSDEEILASYNAYKKIRLGHDRKEAATDVTRVNKAETMKA